MKRYIFLFYGIVVYILFLATLLYFVGFVGNLVVSKGIDGELNVPLWQAIVINVLLLALFTIQHSVMARSWFKVWWTRFVPEPIERSTYVLFTCLALFALFFFWQPMGGMIWNIQYPILSGILMGIFAAGWAIVLVSTFLINHFDLFGLRQVWLFFQDQPYTKLKFRVPVFYKFVRHPLYLGLLIAFWSSPSMSVTRFFFTVVLTIYVLRAIRWEEKDLVIQFGEKYRLYRKRVPMIIPAIINRKEKQPNYKTIFKG